MGLGLHSDVRPRARSWRLRAAMAGVVLVVPVVGASQAAAASAVGSPPEYLSAQQRRVMQQQAPYQELDVKVKELAPATDDSPLTGTMVDLEHHQFHVYWAGQVPAAVRGLRSWASQHGITMVISQAAFTKRELLAAASGVAAFARSTGTNLEIALRPDGSGITVRSEGLGGAVARDATHTGTQAALLEVVDRARVATGVPVTVENLVGSAKRAARNDDWTPHWGGAVTQAIGGRPCTSGFSAYASGDPSMRHMLTVAHCSNFIDGLAVSNGVGLRMGVTDFIAETYDAFRPNGYDLGTIRLDAGKTNQPKVYSNDSISNPYLVVGYAANGIPPGLNYCVSAVMLAPRCNLRSGGEVIPCIDSKCNRYISMTSTDGGYILCGGDSGGPIYFWNSSFTGIYAAGLVGFGYMDGFGCATLGGVSVVATAVNLIPGLTITTN